MTKTMVKEMVSAIAEKTKRGNDTKPVYYVKDEHRAVYVRRLLTDVVCSVHS